MTLLYDQPENTYDSSGLTYDSGAQLRKTKMKKIKLGLSKLNPTATANYATGIVESMTGNAHVPTPDPALSVLTDGADDIRDKQDEIEAQLAHLVMLRGQLGTFTDTLKDNIRKLADNVEDTCDGDVEKLHSTGFTLVGDPQPRGPLGQVQNLRVQISSTSGELNSRWASVLGAATYVVETSTTPDGPWTQATITTRSSYTITELTPGTKYWVRVRAVGTAGFGPWSGPACQMAA